MKVAIAQQQYRVGDIKYNIGQMKNAIQQAVKKQAQVILFGELSVCGYGHYDELFYASFMEEIEEGIQELVALSTHITVIAGAARKNASTVGKSFFNSALVLSGGKITHTIHKTLLPYFDIFEEEKYYERGANNRHLIDIEGKKVALSICADMWAFSPKHKYIENPIQTICQDERPDYIINISASPFHLGRLEERKEVIQRITKTYDAPMLYCNIVGAYDEHIFDGNSLVFNRHGKHIEQLAAFKEDVRIVDLDTLEEQPAINTSKVLSQPQENQIIPFLCQESYVKDIYHALTYGIANYAKTIQAQHVLVASSGGIDSAVSLALTKIALPEATIQSISLPSIFSSEHSVKDANTLAKNLNIPHHIIPIESVYDTTLDLLRKRYAQKLNDIVQENVQSRLRGLLLMSLGNQENALIINTSNKSELATGYGTLYGDMIGGISILGDVFKTQVYALARYINKQHGYIPKSIIEKSPSAELKVNQLDSDTLPDYDMLDSILYCFVHKREGKAELVTRGYQESVVTDVINLYKKSHFKRKQFCPILRITNNTFGQGRKHLITSHFSYK